MRRKNILLKLGVGGAAIALFLLVIGIALPSSFSAKREVQFSIASGEGSTQIAQRLKEQGLIRSEALFHIYAFTTGNSSKLKPGEYQLTSTMPIIAIVHQLGAGKAIPQQFTLIEGATIRDLARILEDELGVSQSEVFAVTGRPLNENNTPDENAFAEDFQFLITKPASVSLEGYLFPDTYRIRKEESIESIVFRMLKNFDQKLTPNLRAEVERQNKTLHEVLTMASLIEREVQTPEDKRIVSGILWKRLENGMPLQVDATLAYILNKRSSRFSIEETKTPSPYNTYQYAGLPPGPISNPGLESIEAALYPEQSPYWFYLSKPSGETVFSRNLQDHNIAKARYLK